jgi:hypothetical protein
MVGFQMEALFRTSSRSVGNVAAAPDEAGWQGWGMMVVITPLWDSLALA